MGLEKLFQRIEDRITEIGVKACDRFLTPKPKPPRPPRPALPPVSKYSTCLEGWVTRDKVGRLQLHSRRPVRLKIFGEWSKGVANINTNHFPDLKWEHDPLYVILELKYEPRESGDK